MKYFEKENNWPPTPEGTAEAILQTLPAVMSVLRHEIRQRRPMDLSLPQFRAMIYLCQHAGASMTEVSEYLGFTPSSTSKLLDHLVQHRLISRKASRHDRRRVILTLTDVGLEKLTAEFLQTRTRLAEMLEGVTATDCQTIVTALSLLCRRFSLPMAGEQDTALSDESDPGRSGRSCNPQGVTHVQPDESC